MCIHPERCTPPVDFRIADTAGAEMLTEEPGRRFLNRPGIVERPQRVVQLEQKRQALFVCAQLGLDPRALGGHFDERDLIARPATRRGAVHAELRQPLPVLEQRHADERGDAEDRPNPFAIDRVDSRIGVDVVDDDRLPTAARVNDSVPRRASGTRPATAGRPFVYDPPATKSSPWTYE